MKRGKKLLLVIVASFFVVAVTASQVFSQASSTTGSGLSVSPTRTELRVEPGGTDVVKINLRNVTGGDIVAKAFVNDFESDGESGEPKIIIDENRESSTSVKPFLKNVTDINLKKGEDKDFDIKVEVPKNAAPGGYFGVIRYAAIPVGSSAPEDGQVALTASVATIVLIEVPGDIREQIQVRDILVYRKNVAGSIFSARPEEIGIKIVNQGNGFSKPFGTVFVKNPFGKQIQQYELNKSDPRSNILPDSTRVFRNPLEGVKLPGRYSIMANVSFGNGGEVLTIRKSFWYLPPWFVVAILVLAGLVTLAVVQIRKRFTGSGFRSHKRKS